ncbi:MAG: right-handed parallel beta-helix repeat-containing protein, partial [Bacteroidales bacterium]|nr:right-handed parallel beta-helix repeat-containing protein [Bacteroidales bacterium]
MDCYIYILDGATLTIDPGVVVYFLGNYPINVQGRLLAQGTATDSIRFTSNATGYANNTHTGWGGIRFDNTPTGNNSSFLDYCIIEYGKNTVDGVGGGITLNNVSGLSIAHCLIQKCSSENGGGMYVGEYSNPALDNSTIAGNTATAGGGIFVNDASHPELTNTTITGNTASSGGGMCVLRESNPVLTNTTIIGNAAKLYGGGMYIDSYSNPVLTNVSIISNGAGHSGGGVRLGFNSGSAEITNSIIWDNLSDDTPGIYAYTNSTLTITYSDIQGFLYPGIGNISQNPLLVKGNGGIPSLLFGSPCINAGNPDTLGLNLGSTDCGGNPRINDGRVDMGASEYHPKLCGLISSDTIWSSDTVLVDCDILIEDGVTLTISPGVTVVFLDNYSLNVQGRLLARGNSSDSIRFTASSKDLATNSHSGWGGIRFDNTSVGNDTSRLEYCMLEYGKVAGHGGGLYMYQYSKLTMSHSVVRNCSAVSGGGIYLSDNSSPVFTHTTISGYGAGVSGGGVYFGNNSSPPMSNSTIIRNTANSYGGGMYLGDNSSPILRSSKINGNTADNGGGMYVFNNSNPVLINTATAGNTAETNGGGMYVSDYSNPKLTNTTISGNISRSGGGGIFVDGNSHLKLTNATISGNTSTYSGGGIYSGYSGNAVLTNCILWGNIASQDAGLDISSSSVFVISYSDIQGTVYAGTGNISKNPLLINGFGDNPQLMPSSPCINAGKPDTSGLDLPLTDCIGNPRFNGDTVDMGANEFHGVQCGLITADTTWSPDTVWVDCDITIPDGVTLTIDPGVTVVFTDKYVINVQGRLLAEGVAGDSIRFTVEDPGNFGITSFSAWVGIVFDETPQSNDTSRLDHCVIEYAGKDGQGRGLYLSQYSKLNVSNSVIRYCMGSHGGGIYLDNSSPVLSKTTISGNSAKFWGGGMYIQNNSNPVLCNTIICRNEAKGIGGGMSIGDHSNPVLSGTTISANTAYQGGGMFLMYSSLVLANTIISGNTANYVGGVDIETYSNAVLTNTIISGNTAENGGGGINVGYTTNAVLTNT